ncbi:enoyl-CoA hydratase/isomerase [Zavarzinia compransoris]|uniref:2-(1,2-epoxy-1,2-dihydrophenyl)acetyl-CoA isomerase n=1 Tax=Zavarzinia compransoris TaxID=1264899 RepID=A0A317EAB3_9PROT|nr:enoyl-CoA hydratase/isomerase [Zavarzinia compransoris]PWR23889.1 2-(1,2-epoxy-1,2-dihydrophenyl)acetyl-CoA isomerase [Zavarzinia compransoris]TDP48131.1 enoyl-CoA hydratase [Zavarzinia compransoris]
MSYAFEKITVDLDDGLMTLTLNQPAALNAVSKAMIREIAAALAIAEDPAQGARALLITGAGRGFCAGANLADPDGLSGDGVPDVGSVLEEFYNPVFKRLRDLRIPIVTAVNGPAAGVGMSFALIGDIVVAAKSASFLQAFAKIGLVPDGGSSWLLPRLVGRARALELALLAEKLPAEKALDWGLINRVVEDADLLPVATGIARKLAKGPTKAIGYIRKMMQASFENSYDQQLDLERQLQRAAGQTADFQEGVAAFLQKRPAQYSGK